MERDQFKRLWLKGGGFIEGVRALKNQAIVAFFIARRSPLLLSFVVLLLCLLIFQVIQVGWQFFWVVPNQKLAAERVTPSWKRELTQKEAHELQNSIRQTFMQAIGGAALLLGFFFTAWTLRISQKTLRVTQEGHITERFTKAIEHLGDKEHLMIRLGGIYALERIARDSDKDHWPIMEVLTAYVRDTAPWIPKEAQPLPEGQALVLQSPRMHTPASSTAEGPALRSIPTDIQAILTVIGRRTRSPNREGKYRLDLHNTDLRSANLREAHLEGANLREAYLEGASLAHAHLEGADLREAHLRPD
jgi:Pentapeptide repeats (8 copies)